MDRVKDGTRGLIDCHRWGSYTKEEKELLAEVSVKAMAMYGQVEAIEALLLQIGDIYAFVIPTLDEMDKLQKQSE